MKKLALLKRLAPYISEDDVDLGYLKFLRTVADRINDDIAKVEGDERIRALEAEVKRLREKVEPERRILIFRDSDGREHRMEAPDDTHEGQ